MLDELLNKESFTREEIIYLLELKSSEEISKLFNKAQEVRKKYLGDDIQIRGVLEISNYCCQDCLFCGMRRSNTAIERYRMSSDEIIQAARGLSNIGVKTIVLEAGEDNVLDSDSIAYVIYYIKQITNLTVSLSLEQRSFEEYKTWRYAGADRYILRFETSNEDLYYKLHNKRHLSERMEHVKFLKSLGYQTGGASLIGFPEQKTEDIADDILISKQLHLDVVSFVPFIPMSNTPYQNCNVGSVDLTLKAVAAARLLLKNKQIPASRAISFIDNSGREKAIKAGADVLLPDITPKSYKDKFPFYPDLLKN